MKIKTVKSSSPIDTILNDLDFWQLANQTVAPTKSARYAVSLMLQVFSSPSMEESKEALNKLIKIGMPVGFIAEEAILHDDGEILSYLKDIKGEKWQNWSRSTTSLNKIPVECSDFEDYLVSVEKTPIITNWILKFGKGKKSSHCMEYILKDKQDIWDPCQSLIIDDLSNLKSKSLISHLCQNTCFPLSLAIAHENMADAKALLKDNRVRHNQKVLDEALFVAYSVKPSLKEPDLNLILELLSCGACPNKTFEVGMVLNSPKKEEDSWHWKECVGQKIAFNSLFLESETTPKIWLKIQSLLEPLTWPAPTGIHKDYFKNALEKVKNNSTKSPFLNDEALSVLAQAPRSFSHENFIAETLLSLLKTSNEITEEARIEEIKERHEKIGTNVFYNSTEIWEEVRNYVQPKNAKNLLAWAVKHTKEQVNLEWLFSGFNAKNLSLMMDVDWTLALDSKDHQVWIDAVVDYKVLSVKNKGLPEDIKEEKKNLFLATLSEKPTLRSNKIRL